MKWLSWRLHGRRKKVSTTIEALHEHPAAVPDPDADQDTPPIGISAAAMRQATHPTGPVHTSLAAMAAPSIVGAAALPPPEPDPTPHSAMQGLTGFEAQLRATRPH